MKGVIELPFINNKLRRHYAEKIRLKQATGKSCDCAKLQGLFQFSRHKAQTPECVDG
jgi:hypothetical protein